MHTLTISTITTRAPLRAIYDCIVTVEIPGMAWATFCGLVAEGAGTFCGNYHWFIVS